jgi:hypothetical protein
VIDVMAASSKLVGHAAIAVGQIALSNRVDRREQVGVAGVDGPVPQAPVVGAAGQPNHGAPSPGTAAGGLEMIDERPLFISGTLMSPFSGARAPW